MRNIVSNYFVPGPVDMMLCKEFFFLLWYIFCLEKGNQLSADTTSRQGLKIDTFFRKGE